MVKPIFDDATIENEAVFRRANEEVQQGVKELKSLASADGHDRFLPKQDIPLHYYCECSDENCQERIVIDPAEYERLHKNRRHFVVLPGHEVLAIEEVVKSMKTYNVVKKYVKPDESAVKLRRTDVNNI